MPWLAAGSTVIAADRGVDRALALGLRVDLAIGDFDSVTPEGLAAAEADGARVERHPAAKDATDLELALDAALALEPARIVVIGSGGGRLDHLLGVVLLLGHERYASAQIEAYLGDSHLHFVRGTCRLVGTPGDLVSLVPLHGPCDGVRTEGLEYPLLGETLPAGNDPRHLERLRCRRGTRDGRGRLPRWPSSPARRNPRDSPSQALGCARPRARALRGGMWRFGVGARARRKAGRAVRSSSSPTTRLRSRRR